MRDANISCGYFKQLKWSSFFFLFFRFWFLYFHQSRSRKIHKMAMSCYWPESIIFFQRWVFQINCKHSLHFVLRWDVAFPRTHMTMRVVGLWLVLLLLLLFLLLLLLRVVGGGSGWQLQKSSYFLFCLMIPDVDPSSLQLTPLHYLVFIRLCKATLQSDSAKRLCLLPEGAGDAGPSLAFTSSFSLHPPHRAPSLAPGSINMQFPSANIFTNEV